MALRKALNWRHNDVQSHDDGVVIIPFGFTINGVSDPDGLIGDLLATVVRSEAGEFLCTLKSKVARAYFGQAGVSETGDDTDITGLVDWSTTKSAGTFVVRTMTGAVQTDPADNRLVGGFLLVSKTTREAR